MKRPSYCCQKCGEQIGWLGRLLWFIHKCNRKANPCNRQLVESAGSVMGDMHALQDQKDWLKKKLLQYEDALRRIAYPKGDSPKSPEATIAFEALNHSKP